MRNSRHCSIGFPLISMMITILLNFTLKTTSSTTFRANETRIDLENDLFVSFECEYNMKCDSILSQNSSKSYDLKREISPFHIQFLSESPTNTTTTTSKEANCTIRNESESNINGQKYTKSQSMLSSKLILNVTENETIFKSEMGSASNLNFRFFGHSEMKLFAFGGGDNLCYKETEQKMIRNRCLFDTEYHLELNENFMKCHESISIQSSNTKIFHFFYTEKGPKFEHEMGLTQNLKFNFLSHSKDEIITIRARKDLFEDEHHQNLNQNDSKFQDFGDSKFISFAINESYSISISTQKIENNHIKYINFFLVFTQKLEHFVIEIVNDPPSFYLILTETEDEIFVIRGGHHLFYDEAAAKSTKSNIGTIINHRFFSNL